MDTVTVTEDRISVVTVGTVGPSGGGGASLAGRMLIVDAVNGDDDTAARGRLDLPFLTPAAAKTAASSGDCITVYPGSYTLTAALGANGKHWDLLPGVTLTNSVGDSYVFTDGGTAKSFIVTGAGALIATGSPPGDGGGAACIYLSHASSVFDITAHSLACTTTATDEEGTPGAIVQLGGTLTVDCHSILNTDINGYGIWWQNGQMNVTAKTITATGSITVGAGVSATPTGDCHVNADTIGSATDGGYIIYNLSAQAEAKLWVTTHLVTGPSAGVFTSGGKTYVTAQKIAGVTSLSDATFGAVWGQGGTSWVHSLKFTGTYGSGVLVTGGTHRYWSLQIEDLGHLAQAIKVTGGTLELSQIAAVMAVGDGLVQTGGTCRLTNVRLDTSAVAGKNPIVKSGGTLILQWCVLVAASGRDSITAATPQTVINYGSVANAAVNVNVTVVGQALVVDSNVV